MSELVIGWDLGGAHLKACRWAGAQVQDVAQWPCPVWQGLPQLEAAMALAWARWPDLRQARHALTMTAEMTDLFEDRADGVARLATAMSDGLQAPVRVYAGPQDAPEPAVLWLDSTQAAAHWARVASANWLATAQHAAAIVGRGVLLDIGSTTTDIIRLADGRPDTRSRSDRDRLASGELVYQGVVRTPLCALATQVQLQGQRLGVMNEWFATTADVYRLTGELDPAHDQQPSADNGPKDEAGSQARLARMVGCDRRDATAEAWRQLAGQWRAAQLARLADAWQQVQPQRPERVVVAGAGAFLAPALMHQVYGDAAAGIALIDHGRDVARAGPLAGWATVCAPSVAVAALLAQT
ncbi:H4MPT-linked C1 transfer pathway protein [Ideonella sp. 4Y11]|uniref:H4MPT-linked C1 transfer pathway protein n=1 Tax=Ideonella aquatica TaxID=2824119 RepID=A0A940YJJ3_9BURK|nr:hydantoinase/oxoprolinase family protein [Ideonella aquatica]MBQ0960684.1 H4MPT-linked C1 transfer pathway protein [Ideonella aquatica]